MNKISLREFQPKPSNIPIPFRLVLGLVLLVLLGTFLLMLPISGATRSLTWNEAMFTTVSALTVTGLSIIVPGRDLTLFGQFVLLILIQFGGTGFMTIAVIFLRLIGWQIRLENRMALRDALGLNNLGEIVKLVRNALVVLFVIELIGAILLWLNWRELGLLTEAQAAWYGLFHAVSAMCNAGFDLFGGLPKASSGVPNDDITLLIMSSLIFLGGIGIPVISNVLTYRPKRFQNSKRWKLSYHVRIALLTSVFLIVFGALGMMYAESQPAGVLANEPSLWRKFTISLAQSVSARTAGFAFFPSFDQITPASRFMLMTLMFIGASPASMGGGIKTVTFAVLVWSLLSYVRSAPEVTLWRRTLSKTTVQKAAAVLTAALFVVITTTWLIALTHGDELDKILFEVISAFATCGLSLAYTSKLDLFGQLVIMSVMFWGRLGALTIVSAVALPRKRTPVTYPEDEVLIG
jgi:trk system potassium uptake protein TrkH